MAFFMSRNARPLCDENSTHLFLKSACQPFQKAVAEPVEKVLTIDVNQDAETRNL